MSRVRSSGSAIERALGKALWAAGLRYRKQFALPGRPDFVLVKQRIAIFCDSEFWHGYGWGERRKREHKTNQDYWFAKIERNRARDRRINARLRRSGWIVMRFWEREIEGDANRCAEEALDRLRQRARSGQSPRPVRIKAQEKSCAQRSSSNGRKLGAKKSSSKRELITPHKGDSHYIRCDAKGRIKEGADVGRSPAGLRDKLQGPARG